MENYQNRFWNLEQSSESLISVISSIQSAFLAVGFPPISKFISALPLALICYVLAFGDFVTSKTLVAEAQESRSDEYIDFNSSRSNLISGLRNLILAIFAPFPPLAGPLWVGMTVSVAMRYKEGKKAMKSPDRWNEFFPYGNIPQCYFGADRVIHEADHGCWFSNHSLIPGVCMCKNRYGIL